MSNETDLDWLARNVHVWEEDWTHVRKCPVHHEAKWMASLSPNAEYKDWRTKQQWLARRAEFQEKPSWAHAPEWAEYMAQSPKGHWEFFAVKPRAECWWRHPIGERSSANNASILGAILGDWRDTLEKRPEQAEFEQFVSVEDAKLTIMQSDGDVKHFGGIIGRRLPLEEDAATAKNCDQVVTINIKPDSTLIHQPHGRIKRITTSKYTKTIHGASVDVYDVLQAWGVSNPALQHLIKKALQCGQRGHKDNAQDLQDIIDSAIRAKELES